MGCYTDRKLVIDVLVANATAMGCELFATALNRSSHVRVIGWKLTSDDAIAAIVHNKPQVALVSIDLQDGTGKGLTVISGVRSSGSDTRCVLLLNDDDSQLIVAAFRAGARGVLKRTDGLAALPKCVRRVSEGQVWADSQELTYVLDTFAEAEPARTLSDQYCKLLTQREQEVVQLVAGGYSNREIADQLNLSHHTVKNYLFQVFDKIGVSNRVELAMCAVLPPNDRLHPFDNAALLSAARKTNAPPDA